MCYSKATSHITQSVCTQKDMIVSDFNLPLHQLPRRQKQRGNARLKFHAFWASVQVGHSINSSSFLLLCSLQGLIHHHLSPSGRPAHALQPPSIVASGSTLDSISIQRASR